MSWAIWARRAARAFGGGGSILPDVIAFLLMSNFRKTSRNSFFDNIFRDSVSPGIGSVILCDLSPIPGLSIFDLNVEHTGIYVGDGKIIHRTGEYGGKIEEITPSIFLDRLGGKNFAVSIYVACSGKTPINIINASTRAKLALKNSVYDGYDLLKKNCHHFTRYCITGDLDRSLLDFTFYSLQQLLIDDFGLDNWRVWNYE